MKRVFRKMAQTARRLWRDEKGNMVENLGWLVAVSVGVAVIGGVIYTASTGLGGRVKSKVDNWT